ncbi:hypothetical protein MCEL_04620 [Mycolicibacterium celeriflavum]|uniref:Uncharacterized protein n=1 Tax=Mycolicibacterium celeriflavum TaxID=1249101 RepID=A0A7I7RCF3_MYCCF|nr:hypothetical protein MCEL_04620 [Mycolicibacterium celeriflavum]
MTTAGRWFVSGSESPEPVASAINAVESRIRVFLGLVRRMFEKVEQATVDVGGGGAEVVNAGFCDG